MQGLLPLLLFAPEKESDASAAVSHAAAPYFTATACCTQRAAAARPHTAQGAVNLGLLSCPVTAAQRGIMTEKRVLNKATASSCELQPYERSVRFREVQVRAYLLPSGSTHCTSVSLPGSDSDEAGKRLSGI